MRSVVDKHNKKCGFVEDNSGRLKHRSEITNHFKHLKSIKKRLINKKELKLVGFTFDSKMTMEPMVKKTSKKGRAKIAALFRLRPYLSSDNLELMYKAFVRSAMEYGSLEYMIAAPSNLQKLDRIQATAERLGGFKVESLESKRDASLIG